MKINNSEQIMRVVEKYCRDTLDVDLMVDSNRIMEPSARAEKKRE